jgi:hypothetical protein
MADEIIKTALLDRHMKEAFDWSDSDMPVRDAPLGLLYGKEW